MFLAAICHRHTEALGVFFLGYLFVKNLKYKNPACVKEMTNMRYDISKAEWVIRFFETLDPSSVRSP